MERYWLSEKIWWVIFGMNKTIHRNKDARGVGTYY